MMSRFSASLCDPSRKAHPVSRRQQSSKCQRYSEPALAILLSLARAKLGVAMVIGRSRAFENAARTERLVGHSEQSPRRHCSAEVESGLKLRKSNVDAEEPWIGPWKLNLYAIAVRDRRVAIKPGSNAGQGNRPRTRANCSRPIIVVAVVAVVA